MQPSATHVHDAQAALQYATPVIVLLYYLGSSISSTCTLQKGLKYKSSRSRWTIIGLVCFVLFTYVTQSALLVIDAFTSTPRLSGTAPNVNALSSALLWFLFSVVLLRSKRPVWYPYVGSWLITLLSEIVALSLFASGYTVSRVFSILFVGIWASRTVSLLAVLTLYATARFQTRPLGCDEESTSLLKHKDGSKVGQQASAQPNGAYGSIAVTDENHDSSTDDEDSDAENPMDKEAKRKQKLITDRLKKDGNWFTYLRGFSIFLPMIWPSKQPRLYLNMVGCGVCLLCGRALNLLVPYQLGVMVDSLTTGHGSFYKAIGLYSILQWASSAYGMRMIESLLWLPMERYSYLSLQTATYNQIMELSSDFHDNKQSGELYKAIHQGSSITSLLDMFLFELGPMAMDVVVGFIYLNYRFGPYMALLAVGATSVYIATSTHFNLKQAKMRRGFQDLSRKLSQVMYDTVGSWATVSYFNQISYEEERYKKAVTDYKAMEQLYYRLGYLYNGIGTVTMDLGRCAALLLAGYQVTHGSLTVGEFIQLLTYWGIYTGPMMWFARAHKRILANLVDAEQLLRLFQHERKVIDGRQSFYFKGGAVEFKDVHFSYDGTKQIIKGLSFAGQPGQKIALVGETGGGKSTLLKMLFRFHDVTAGSLCIDGQDVRDITLQSLRKHIGVVPQDPSMFNDTIMNNVRYSRLDATDDEVMEACKAAAIHDKILSFTDKYASKVGEKGVKLSGGELQRLAIARAMLKNPNIILLDEATSSVDTQTETQIQSALHELTRGRTTFTVAHRLSTVVDADIILVIQDGMILERGPPQELLATKGKYYDLWGKQNGITTVPADPKVDVPNLIDAVTENTPDDMEARKENQQARPGSSEKKKIWRPDVPEFIPKNMRGSTTSGTQSKQVPSSLVNRKASPSKQQRSKGKGSAAQVLGQSKRQRALEDGIGNLGMSAVDGAADKAWEIIDEEPDLTANESGSKPKRARSNGVGLRSTSKSEPFCSSAGNGAEAVAFTAAPEDSREGVITERRRVSAPSAPGKAAGQGRRDRRKHWRKGMQGSSSQTHSEPQSARTSATWSTDPSVLTFVPTATPGNSDGADGVGGSNVGKGGVRFANGT